VFCVFCSFISKKLFQSKATGTVVTSVADVPRKPLMTANEELFTHTTLFHHECGSGENI